MGVVLVDTRIAAGIVRLAEAWMPDFVVSGVLAAAVEGVAVAVVEGAVAVVEEVVAVFVEVFLVAPFVVVAVWRAWRAWRGLLEESRCLVQQASTLNPS